MIVYQVVYSHLIHKYKKNNEKICVIVNIGHKEQDHGNK